MMKAKMLRFIPVMMVFPAVVIGCISMRFYGISLSIYGQNFACLILGGLIAYFITSVKLKIGNINGYAVIISTLVLLLTFIDPGIEGVHRWIGIGPVKFYIGSIVMPIIIIGLWNMAQKSWWSSVFITIGISVLLVLQPDASQLTAFVIAMSIDLWNKGNNNFLKLSIIGLLMTLVVILWIFLDSLAPVPYVEGIINLARNIGKYWLIVAVVSLVILPTPFIFFPPENFKLLSMGIGIYYIVILVSTQLGNFPIPLMGYGISPIIGYFIAITWLIRNNISGDRIDGAIEEGNI